MANQRSKATTPIRAQVVLKGGDKSLLGDQPVTAANIRDYLATPEAVEQATKILKRLGFHILGSSPIQLTVEALPAQFEQVFKSSLLSRSPQKGAGPRSKAGAAAKSTAWEWSGPPQLPDDLRERVDAIVFPQPYQMLR